MSEFKQAEHFGCDQCWPESAEAAWHARSGLTQIQELIDESHFHVTILACAECDQRFVSVFTETIDWTDGEDPQCWMLVPVTEAESRSLMQHRGTLTEPDLNSLGAGRRCLQRDHPKTSPARVLWRTGIFVGAHN